MRGEEGLEGGGGPQGELPVDRAWWSRGSRTPVKLDVSKNVLG